LGSDSELEIEAHSPLHATQRVEQVLEGLKKQTSNGHLHWEKKQTIKAVENALLRRHAKRALAKKHSKIKAPWEQE